MNKYLTAGQIYLTIYSIVIAVLLLLPLTFANWFELNNKYENYLAEMKAYEICIQELRSEAAQSEESSFKWVDIVQKRAAQKAVEEIWCVDYGKINAITSPGTYSQHLSVKAKSLLIPSLALFVGAYILLNIMRFYVMYDHLGWQRVAKITAIIPAILVLYFLLNNSRNIGFKEPMVGFLLVIGGYMFGILLVLGGRSVFCWVREGFVPKK